MSADGDATIAKLDAVWSSLLELGESLDADEWLRLTDCPGWTVQDNYAHVSGAEAALAGDAVPEHHAPAAGWVKNELGRHNEDVVDRRRSWPPRRLLDELADVRDRRLTQLRAMDDDELLAESWTPNGPGTVLDLLRIRVLDAWVHEQDVRRATGRPGRLEGPAAEHVADLFLRSLPMVVGKRVGPPEGTTVVVELTGSVRRTLALVIADGRARVIEAAPPAPSVRLRTDLETLTVLAGGRRDPRDVLDGGRVDVEGDVTLGRAIVEHLPTTP